MDLCALPALVAIYVSFNMVSSVAANPPPSPQEGNGRQTDTQFIFDQKHHVRAAPRPPKGGGHGYQRLMEHKSTRNNFLVNFICIHSLFLPKRRCKTDRIFNFFDYKKRLEPFSNSTLYTPLKPPLLHTPSLLHSPSNPPNLIFQNTPGTISQIHLSRIVPSSPVYSRDHPRDPGHRHRWPAHRRVEYP